MEKTLHGDIINTRLRDREDERGWCANRSRPQHGYRSDYVAEGAMFPVFITVR